MPRPAVFPPGPETREHLESLLSESELELVREFCRAVHVSTLEWTSSPVLSRLIGAILARRKALELERKGVGRVVAFERGCRSIGLVPETVASWARRERLQVRRRK